MPDAEIWKPVKGFEGLYEVSSLGRVRSVERRVKHGEKFMTVHARILKLNLLKGGMMVHLSRDNIVYSKSVSKLVAEAFLAAKPPGNTRILHIDGDICNNAAANLRYRKSFYLPENTEARKLFNECAEKNVRIFIYKNQKFIHIGIIDAEDFLQEALLKIWKDIDCYDGKISFMIFCNTKCEDTFKSLYRKYVKIKSREISAYEICASDPEPLYLIDTLVSSDNFYERIDANA